MKNCPAKKSSFKRAYVAYSLLFHGVMAAFFLIFYEDVSLAKKQNGRVFEVYLETRPQEISLPEALPAPTKGIAKKLPLAHRGILLKKAAPIVAQAAVIENSGREIKNEDDDTRTFAKSRKTPVLLNKHEVTIPYPKRALQYMIEGVVRLRLTVSEQGVVTKVSVVSGPQFGLQNAALVVARKLIFLPATDENGHAMASDIVHDVIFRLKS